MIKYFIIFNSQGKVRLHKCYGKDKVEDSQSFLKTLFQLITQQTTNSSNYFAIPSMPKGTRAVYRRYASLYIVTVIDAEESELALFDLIHMIAEGFDALFENASELDILFNPEKVYLLLDEIIVGGTIIETNLKETMEAFKLHTNIRSSAVTTA